MKVRFGGQKCRPKLLCYIAVTWKTAKTRWQLCGERGNQEERTNILGGRSAK